MTLHTIEQAKRAVRSAGGHWFDAETLRFFGSRIGGTVYSVPDGCLFVSSEHTGFDRQGRAYSVRYVSDAGEVDTVGDFLQYRTREAAHSAAKREQRRLREAAQSVTA
jgi:hypothetical protein